MTPDIEEADTIPEMNNGHGLYRRVSRLEEEILGPPDGVGVKARVALISDRLKSVTNWQALSIVLGIMNLFLTGWAVLQIKNMENIMNIIITMKK